MATGFGELLDLLGRQPVQCARHDHLAFGPNIGPNICAGYGRTASEYKGPMLLIRREKSRVFWTGSDRNE
jgi:hypothetical protein